MAAESRTLVVLALIANGVIAVVECIAAATEVPVNLDEALDPNLSTDDAESAIDRIEERIQVAVPEASRNTIELESLR